MSKNFRNNSDKSHGRAAMTLEDYNGFCKSIIDYYAAHDVTLAKLESKLYPATGGVQISATVTVGYQPAHGTAIGVAFRYVSAVFRGVYQPRLREVDGAAEPTFVVSWFLNQPDD